MFTSISLWIRPTWDVADYSVTATWKDDDLAVPVVLSKQGTMECPPYAGPGEMLSALAAIVSRPSA